MRYRPPAFRTGSMAVWERRDDLIARAAFETGDMAVLERRAAREEGAGAVGSLRASSGVRERRFPGGSERRFRAAEYRRSGASLSPGFGTPVWPCDRAAFATGASPGIRTPDRLRRHALHLP